MSKYLIRNAKMGCDAAMRFVNKFSSNTVILANSYSSAEPYVGLQLEASQVWASIVAHTACTAPRPFSLTDEALRLAYATYKQSLLSLAGMRVAV